MEHSTPSHHEAEYNWEAGQGKRHDKFGNEVDRYHRTEANLKDYSGYSVLLHDTSFLAVRPWLGAIVAPSNLPQVDLTPPPKELKIEHVYGYRAIDSRQNVFYSSNPNEIVYMTAALGILLNTKDNTQRILGGGEKTTFQGHEDDVTALTASADRNTIVTGQVGKEPSICVWDAKEGSLVGSFRQGRDTKAVRSLGISSDNKFIASVAGDDNHSVFLFDAETGKQVATGPNGPDPILDLSFSPHINSGTYEFVSVGKNGGNFWTWNGKTLEKKKGLFGSHKMADMWCAAYTADGKAITGSTLGAVYLWEGHSCTKTFNCHSGMVTAISYNKGTIVTSGKDNQLITWDEHFVKKSSVTLSTSAKAIDIAESGKIVVGLRDGSIVEVDGSNVTSLMRSHADGELWGLDVCPKTGLIATTADDNRILVWDPKARKLVGEGIVNEKAGEKAKILGASTLSSFPPNQCSRAVAVNTVNGHVAVGVNNGELHIRASVTDLNKSIALKHDAKEWIEVLRYSPCGKYLAVGSHDNNVYVYDVGNSYHLLSKFHKQTAFITSLDWSTDSLHLQSVSGSYELLFSEAATGKHLTEGGHSLKDEKWATWTVKLGWPVQGIFPAATEGCFINGVDRSNKGDLLATGDDHRLVNIHRYPALHGSVPKSYVGHAEHVVRVKFDEKDEYLYSIGGYDRTLIQWKIL